MYLKDFLQRIILDMLTIMEVNVKTKPPKIYQNDNNLYSWWWNYGLIFFFSFSYPYKFYKNSNNQH